MSNKLHELKNCIESMSKYHQIEILRKLSIIDGANINENNNGTFINLTEQSENVIVMLEKYTIYVNEQQQQLNQIEDEKTLIKETYF
jgi:hypothetical protein